jgi:hypothetical protein
MSLKLSPPLLLLVLLLIEHSAEVMMDFHAHMDRNEVIGLLAGSWDPQQVIDTYACTLNWQGQDWGRDVCLQRGGCV